MRDEAYPEASVYSRSMEIKESMPVVIAEAEKLGYHIDEMSIGGLRVFDANGVVLRDGF